VIWAYRDQTLSLAVDYLAVLCDSQVDAGAASAIRLVACTIVSGHSRRAVCGNTKEGMEKKEGQPIIVLSEAVVVPSGVVRLMELQEKGWSYVRP